MTKLTRRAALGALGAGAAAIAGCVSDDTANDPADNDGNDTDNNDNKNDNNDNDNMNDDNGGENPETSIELVASTCAGPNHGDVSVFLDEDTYFVEGEITSPTPCYEPILESSGFEDGTLSLSVDVVEEETDMECVECVGGLSYDAAVTAVDPATVDRVEVNHVEGDTYTFEAGEIPDGRPELVEAEIKESSSRPLDSEQKSFVEVGESESETGVVTINGGIPTNTPHYEAVLDEASMRGGTLTVSVGLESTMGDSDVGTQPLGFVEYSATAEIRHPNSIERVRVEHPDSQHEVAWNDDTEPSG